MRSHVERCIALIARGEMSRAAVVRHLLDEMLLKFRFFVRHASRMAALFDAAFGQRNSEGQLVRASGTVELIPTLQDIRIPIHSIYPYRLSMRPS